MQRIQRHQANNGCTVWIRDDAVMVLDILSVNLWDYQRNVWVHSKCMGVVNADASTLNCFREQLFCLLVASCAKDNIYTLKSLWCCFANYNLLASKFDSFTSASSGCQKHQLLDRKITLFKALHHLSANNAGSTKNCNNLTVWIKSHSYLETISSRTNPL